VNGGERAVEALAAQGVSHLFALCGGHISPLLVAAESRGMTVVDVRHEASAVFAADAQARLAGGIGVAVVTAGPGVTNTITAVKNAQLAQSPVVLLGGAAATILRGRGALQDIDQLATLRPHVKWAGRAERRRDIIPLLEWAAKEAQRDVPGPVFVELPVDLLYDEAIVRSWYGLEGAPRSGTQARLQRWVLDRHLARIFATRGDRRQSAPQVTPPPGPRKSRITAAAKRLRRAKRPLLLVGSQAMSLFDGVQRLADAIRDLGVPCYLSGTARGLLGVADPLQFRHRRKQALREADLVLLAGVPCDFRLNYGRQIPASTPVIGCNRSATDLELNRRPDVPIQADPALVLRALAKRLSTTVPDRSGRQAWLEKLRRRDTAREKEIEEQGRHAGRRVHPVALCQAIDTVMEDDSVLVVDGGDFVATASYITRPRSPLSWLDPGVFGTLGVGGGFALGARCHRPDAEVWILYGDGASAYSLAEFDTFVRHGWPVIALVGNDASWAQIAREQVDMLGSSIGTELRRTDYHRVAEGYGGRGLLLDRPDDTMDVLQEAKRIAARGVPVLVNALLAESDFRKGSISM
jgi:thiamine pyrophosphate-dependent acetolactate synthase large subunit-like protein